MPTSVAKVGAGALLRITNWTAWFVALMVTFVPPLAYLSVQYTRVSEGMRAEAQLHANDVTELVQRDPEHWKLQESRFVAMLARPAIGPRVPETKRVLARDGQVVAEKSDMRDYFYITVEAPFYDAGEQIGMVQVSRSIQSIVTDTGGIFLLSIWLSGWTFVVLRTLPARALTDALQELDASKDAAFAVARERDQAEAAARMRASFMANMSHELRTPMNGVLGMIDLVLDSPLEDEQREYLKLAHTSAENLLRLLNDILDFSKIDAGKLTIQRTEVQLHIALQQLVATMTQAAHAKGLALNLALDASVPAQGYTDEARFRQILVNLVGNAIKFTSLGGVTIQVKGEPRSEGTWLNVAVIDTGIGVAPERLASIFEAFTQADDSTTRSFGGTGLGLTISRQLAELMGGTLTAESTPGQGSTFLLSLPLQTPARRSTDRDADERSDGPSA